MRSAPSPHKLALAVLLPAAVLIAGVIVLSRTITASSRPFRQLEPYLEPAVRADYSRLTPEQQSAVAETNLPLIAEIRETGWKPRATGMLPTANGGPPQLLYRLAGDRAELRGCRFELFHERPAGYCKDGFSYVPSFEDRRHDVVVPLVVRLDPVPLAETAGEIEMPVTDTMLTRGRVQVTPGDVRLLEAEMRVPHPLQDEDHLWGPVRDFSLVLDLDIVSRARVDIDLVLPMPGDMEPLPLARLDVLVRIDLRPENGTILLEGELAILGQSSGAVRALYVPRRYASIQLASITLPVAPPYFCLSVESLLVEADVEQDRIRLAFYTEIGAPEALVCAFAGEETGGLPGTEVLTNLIEKLLDWTRESLKSSTGLSLPAAFRAGGHLVLDVGNGVMCLDLGAQRRSLFKGAYFIASRTLIVEAPVLTSSRLTGLDDIAELAAKLGRAPASFPEMDPTKCWEADPGPRADAVRGEIDAIISDMGW